ncbi:Uncharacterized protein dnm_056680 [Desulfonema magnum]|uniref:Uncharacterized protein n=1 Tax=Desulfonema magnum TaxID=45655 RepID=A0A975BQH3_9BACT|nr:Uncharacterized protein dnm_056680 [Desulfonema magnum]
MICYYKYVAPTGLGGVCKPVATNMPSLQGLVDPPLNPL